MQNSTPHAASQTTIITPANPKNTIVIYLHGHQIGPETLGGKEAETLMTPLLEAGYTVVAPDMPGYGISKVARDYCGPKSVQNALEVAQNKDLVPGDFVLLGASRGAALAALVAKEQPAGLRGLCCLAGFYDLKKFADTLDPNGRPYVNLQKETSCEDEALRVRSAIEFTNSIMCPVSLIHGENDPVVPASQSREFYQQLIKTNPKAALHILPQKTHKLFSLDVFNNIILPFLDKATKS